MKYVNILLWFQKRMKVESNPMKKYRPYLTLAELKILHQSCPSPSLTIYLHRYIQDIESGSRESNYVPVPTMSQKLGFTDFELSSKQDLAQKRKLFLYEHWAVTDPKYMTKEEISLVQEYRLENNLMTIQEEVDYVKELLDQSSPTVTSSTL